MCRTVRVGLRRRLTLKIAIKQNNLLLHTLARRIGWLHDQSRQISSSAQVQPALSGAESHIPPLATNQSATISAGMDVTERADEVSVEASARYVRQSEPTQQVVHNEHESPSVRRGRFERKRRDDLNPEENNSRSASSGAYILGPGGIPRKVLDEGNIPRQESAPEPTRRPKFNRRARTRRALRRRAASRASHLGLDSCID